MGCATASTLFMLTLLMGMVKEDGTMAVGLVGKATPDWKGYEDLLKNISGSRHPGTTNLNDHGENVSKPILKSFMQYLDKTCTMYGKHALC